MIVRISPDRRSRPRGGAGPPPTRGGGGEAVGWLVEAIDVVGGDPRVDRVEEPLELQIGEGTLVEQRPRELGPAVVDAGEATDEPHAQGAQGVEVDGGPP